MARRGTTGGADKGAGKSHPRRGPGETRKRSAAATERRLHRGALRRAETYLKDSFQNSESVAALKAEDLDYGEALALQAQPGQGSSSSSGFLNDTASVRGGLEREQGNKTASKVYKKFQEKYPELATVIAQNPGKGTRKSYLREAAAKRVAQGLGRIGEEERLSTFHQGGPSSSGEPQETEEPQDKKAKSEVDYNEAGPAEEVPVTIKEESEYRSVDSQGHKATTVYYSSEEETEVKNERGTSSTVKQEVPIATAVRGTSSTVRQEVPNNPADRAEARGEERRSNWSNYSDYTAESYDTNWTDREPPQQRQWTWQDYYNAYGGYWRGWNQSGYHHTNPWCGYYRG